MKGNLSPEEKLLRLIRGEKKAESQPAPAALTTPLKNSHPQTPRLKISVKKYAGIYFRNIFAFKNLRRLLPVLMVFSILYLAASLIYPVVGLKKIKLPEVLPDKTEELFYGQKEEIKPLEYYTQGAQQRQIFATQQVSGQAASTGAETTSIKDINLIGIIAGENPQAIIEDKKAQKTYYVTKGQLIGEFSVEEIQEGKIILSGNGQKFELHI